ncbi:odorant receptor 22b-like isoform X2 [Linepithema humile]|uniref:odorant receptor 22b-like isoform X2 n=1 Tax=Linepithema humile TaxID=83485 RepID=UPI00351E55CF
MNEHVKEYYALNKFFLSRIGVWPYQHKALKILLPCFLSALQYFGILTEVFLLQENWGDMDIAVESMINTCSILVSNAKLINIIVNNEKFRLLLQFMNDHWVHFNSKSERHILRHYAAIGRRVTKYYAAFFYIIFFLYLLIPLIPRVLDIVVPLNESRPLKYLYQGEYKVDKEKYYYPILLYAFVAIIINMSIIMIIDTMYIVCVLHTCSLFTAISHRLENIEKHHSADNNYHELMACLKKHQLALEYVRLLNSTFTYVTFLLLFLNIMGLSVIGLQVLNKLGNTEEVVRFACLSLGVISHLICMCFPGQLLMDRSAEVFDKAYCSQWYTFSAKSKRLLGILLHKSLVPCSLLAGKFVVISMALCSSVMQTAMSYFTALLSMR